MDEEQARAAKCLWNLRARAGTYVLIIYISSSLRFTAGSLGVQTLPPGHYTYTGSALGKGATGMPGRIMRHLNPRKNYFWHIDHLLETENSRVVSVITVLSDRKLECTINHIIRVNMDTQVLIPGFGASDCQANCSSHLLYLPYTEERNSLVENVVRSISLAKPHPQVKVFHF